MLPDPVRGVLVDVAGVLHVGDEAVPGAREALEALRAAGLPVRFLTNTTRSTRRSIALRLRRLGFAVEERDILTAALAARRVLEERRLVPWLLVHPDLEPEFAGLPAGRPDAVVVGDAGDAFTYARMNGAFRLLANGAALVAMGTNRFFRDGAALSLDMGPFVRALEYAAGVRAEVVGKPASSFFEAALADLGIGPGEAVAIGDDVEIDVGGPQACGVRSILVRTGKYRPGDEDGPVRPDAVCDDVLAAVRTILDRAESYGGP